MATFKMFDIRKANATLTAAEEALAPALVKAGITQISMDGKSVPAEDAPLASLITALIAVAQPGDGQQNLADLLITNDTLAKELDRFKIENTTALATVQALQRDVRELTTRSETAEKALGQATDRNAQSVVEFKAATDTIGRMTSELRGVNAELSSFCLSIGCLELTGEDGKPLDAKASSEQKRVAAERLPIGDKLKGCAGAVSAAISKVGVASNTIPSASVSQSQTTSTLTGVERAIASHRAGGKF